MAVDVGNVCFLAFFLVLVILYGLFTEYATPAEVSRYAFFQDVHMIIFIGFGFLMTPLPRRRGAHGAVGHTGLRLLHDRLLGARQVGDVET